MEDVCFLSSLNLVSTNLEVSTGLPDPSHNDIPVNLVSLNNSPCGRRTSKYRKCITTQNDSLPISTIISRIQAEDSDVEAEDDDDYSANLHPPPSHTGGKWKPPSYARENSNEAIACNMEVQGLENSAVNEGMDSFHCDICDSTFTRKENLIKHLTAEKHRKSIDALSIYKAAKLYTENHKQVVKYSRFICKCCMYAPVDHPNLIVHLKSQQHTENVASLKGPLECEACGFLDYDGTLMLKHCSSKSHKENAVSGCALKERRSQIQCNLCDKILHSTSHYSQHLRNSHSEGPDSDCETKNLKCGYCDFEGKSTALSQHVRRTHVDCRPYLCAICNAGFPFAYDLKKHCNTGKHINNVLESYKSKLAPSKVNISASPIKSGFYNMKCKFCRFVTPELSHLQEHYISHHEELCPHVDDGIPIRNQSNLQNCRYCSASIVKEDLLGHEISHIQKYLNEQNSDAITSENVRCFLCFIEVPDREYESHVQQHTKKKIYATSSDSKISQTNKSEVNDKRFKCTVEGCCKSYKTKGDLNVHLLTHNKEYKFKCEDCPKAFPTRKQLKAHALTHQLTSKFNCEYCNYKSKTRFHLTRHMRIHAGSRPYSCPYCHYSSTTIGNLRKHILQTNRHKGMAMYNCNESNCDFFSNTNEGIKQHLQEAHGKLAEKFKVKSTENDWIDVIEGHPIIPVQH